MNYLASPPLVVAYALAGTMDIDLVSEPLGVGSDGEHVFLRDIWPTTAEVSEVVQSSLESNMFRAAYGRVFEGEDAWRELPTPAGGRYTWDGASTYVRQPPYFVDLPEEPSPLTDIADARVLAVLGDSVTTDHISPAGAIHPDSPAARYLMEQGVERVDFNSYGSRRGNHEVMIRGTFANRRIRNRLAPGTEGGVTRHLPDGETMSIYDAAMRYADEGVPLVILAGKEYGSGSSRDWAAKGTSLLGVRAVLAESFERIHRSNLIGMGVLPLQFAEGASVESLGLTGEETITIAGLAGTEPKALIGRRLTVEAAWGDGGSPPDSGGVSRSGTKPVEVVLRIDTPMEAEYLRHGGILPYVLRQHLARGA
jgi:aconitate hydratase